MRRSSRRTVKVSIESRSDDVRFLAAAVRAICAELDLEPFEIMNVELCAVEAVNNAIEHAYLGCPGNEVTVCLTSLTDGVQVSVSDVGEAMPASAFERCESVFEFDASDLESVPERGMGLALIKQIMAEVIYRSAGGVNTLTFRPEIGANAQ